MENYLGFNINETYKLDEEIIGNRFPDCWLLFQQNLEAGVNIRIKFPIGPLLKLTHVIPESLHLIRYSAGECYFLENLFEELEANCLELDQVLGKRDVHITSDSELAAVFQPDSGIIRAWTTPKVQELSEITANENGFCEFGPIHTRVTTIMGLRTEESKRLVQVHYRPNAKKLNKAVFEQLTCNLDLNKSKFDYKEYFNHTLADEQMTLSLEESLELYDALHEQIDRFIIDGGDTLILRNRSGEEGSFVHEGKVLSVSDYPAKFLFKAWIKDELEKVLNKAIVMGIMKEHDWK